METLQHAVSQLYVRIYEALDHSAVSELMPFLDDNVEYSSAWVRNRLVGKTDYEEYLHRKINTLEREHARLDAYIMSMEEPNESCVIIKQESFASAICFYVGGENSLITKIAMVNTSSHNAGSKIRKRDNFS